MEQETLTKDRVIIEYYTDPLCCWSYAMEASLQKLIHNNEEDIDLKLYMAGLISEWNKYSDPINDIAKPGQMGPLWQEAAQVSGVQISPNIWNEDPPASSYPACIAVKCAEFQSKEAGQKLFLELRKAVMVDGQNISKKAVIFQIAEEMERKNEIAFSSSVFKKDMNDGKGIEEFKADLYEKDKKRISRVPAMIFKNQEGKGRIIYGYRPFEVLEELFLHVKNKTNQL